MQTGLRITVCLAVLLVAGTGRVVTAGNGVPATRAGKSSVAISANTLKPASCAALTLTKLVVGVTGTSGADLLVGTAGADTMKGAGGTDCILGGGGNDSINGGAGVDVCIGGPGADTFSNCETQTQ